MLVERGEGPLPPIRAFDSPHGGVRALTPRLPHRRDARAVLSHLLDRPISLRTWRSRRPARQPGRCIWLVSAWRARWNHGGLRQRPSAGSLAARLRDAARRLAELLHLLEPNRSKALASPLATPFTTARVAAGLRHKACLPDLAKPLLACVENDDLALSAMVFDGHIDLKASTERGLYANSIHYRRYRPSQARS